MKHVLGKGTLVGLSLLLLAWFINVANGAGVSINTPNNDELHRASLFSLFLGETDEESSWLKVLPGKKQLNVLKGLIIGSNTPTTSGNLIMIGGGLSNTVSADNAGIGGGERNTVSANNAGIGGGLSNMVNANADNAGIGGGQSNIVDGVGGVVLGGQSNTAGEAGLAMGKNAKGNDGSFVWSDGNATPAGTRGARINTTRGVLIGTLTGVDGVKLVVNGAIKLGKGATSNGGTPQKGEIALDDNNCIKVKNNNSVHTLGKISEDSPACGSNEGCQFGTTMIQDGESVTAYKESYSTNCNNNSNRKTVVCRNGQLKDGDAVVNYYPNCYKISDNPLYD